MSGIKKALSSARVWTLIGTLVSTLCIIVGMPADKAQLYVTLVGTVGSIVIICLTYRDVGSSNTDTTGGESQ